MERNLQGIRNGTVMFMLATRRAFSTLRVGEHYRRSQDGPDPTDRRGT